MSVKSDINTEFSVGEVTVSKFDDPARIKLKDFYKLDQLERKKILELADKVDIALNNLKNEINDKFTKYSDSSELDGRLAKYSTVSEVNSKISSLKNELNNYVSKSLLATDNKAGIISKNEVRNQISSVSGIPFNGIFGDKLKNITAGNSYLYINESGKEVLYTALITKSQPIPWTRPNNTEFKEYTLRYLFEKLHKDFYEFESVTYNPQQNIFWKFWRFGKRAFFHINYYIPNGIKWPDRAEVADFPKGFKPDNIFYSSTYPILNHNDNNKSNLLLEDKIYMFGHDPNVPIYAVRGTISYITE